MDRSREARRTSMAASANGLSRRRHRSNSLRDSPEEDGPLEMQEPARLRDRGLKKDRDRDRERSSRSKRRRGDRMMHGSNRDDGGEDSSEESVNDEEDDDDDEGGGGSGGVVRMLPPMPAAAMSSSLSNHHHLHRKSYPLSASTKNFRPVQGWKPADEMIGFTVPRKARTASTKRSHECSISGSGAGGEQFHPQVSTSPVRQSLASSSTPPPAPISPSSSNVSLRKKMRPNGPKLRPPKSSSSKSPSSNAEELEIEIAEVLYGLKTQPQVPSKKEIMGTDSAKFDFRELNKSSSDAKSRVSSPISNSTSTAPQPSSLLPQNSGSNGTPLSAVAPKRKRPRQVSDNLGSFSVGHSPISSTTTAMTKVEVDLPLKTEISSSNLDKNPGSAAANGSILHDFAGSQAGTLSSEPQASESTRPETFSDSKLVTEETRETRDFCLAKEEAVTSPKKESPVVRADGDREVVTKENSTTSKIESQREDRYEIDLMAPPPQLRSSPERDADVHFVATSEQKPVVPNVDAGISQMVKDKKDEKATKSHRDDALNPEPEQKKAKLKAEDVESEKPVVGKERNFDLQLDLEKPGVDMGSGSVNGNKLYSHVQKQTPQHTEKTAQSSSLPLPISVPSWPGGLPAMGYMAPLQGVVSMDGNTVSPTPIQPLFSQPRPKRCATHCYIARNIDCFQQFLKINPFWQAAAGSATLFGAKPCNLNAVPPTELHGNIAARGVNSVPDKGPALGIFTGHSGKDKGSQAMNITDAQRKQQILLQQAMPPGAPPSNILHGPTFIFPLNQQQQSAAVAAASVRPGSVKSPTSVASTNASNSASVSGSATATPAAAAVSFNYPSMPTSETQYLAILQNNYPFPIPGVGAPPSYRGTHAQAMPYFNGSFYSSQMIHPSQLQQQQLSTQPHQLQQGLQQLHQGHQNTSLSSGSSSSQKHLQSQQQRPQSSATNGGNGSGNLHSFSAPKNRPSQAAQQQPNQHMPTSHQARHIETEVGGEDSPSSADSRVSRPTMSVYGQNFAVPIHSQNFALMTPPSALAGATGGSGNHSEKKQQQQAQQLGLKAGVESLPPQTFAMSFASMNGASTPPGIDISSMTQNHAVLQSLPEATGQSYQIMAAAFAAQAAQASAHHKKNFRSSEESKATGGDSSNVDEDKKCLSGKVPATVGQSIVFSRPDLPEASVSTVSGTSVIDSSARSLNLVSAPSRSSRSALPNATGTLNFPNHQLPALQHQQQYLMQLHKQQHQQQQQLAAVAAARNKSPATSNGSVYGDHLVSAAPSAAKFPSALSGFPQNLVQSSSNSSPSQSPQWKNSSRTTSQVPSSLVSSTTSSLKNLPQQQSRSQQSHTQISFGASQKASTATQGQHATNSHQAPSPPMVVGSPTTSSMSKGAGGSPRTTTSSSAGNKASHPSSLSSQQPKNSSSVQSQKSSPVGGRNAPSILGNPHITSSSSTGGKPQMQQQQLPKQTGQQPQLFFSHAYMQPQAPHSSVSSTNAYMHRRRSDQQQQSQQPQGSSSTASSTGMMSLCPVTLTTASTSDAKAAAAAAASNMKVSGLPSQGILHPAQFTAQTSGNSHQLMPAGFSYVHAVPAPVQVKPAEQKQPAGNDNLHACWQPEKK